MSLSQQLAGDLPFLRRYARALSGSQATGDAMVRRVLELALKDDAVRQSIEASSSGGKVALFKAFQASLVENGAESGPTPIASEGANPKEANAARKLAAVNDQKRQALLLTTVEEFTAQQAAQILTLETNEVEGLVREAIAEIDAEQKTRVLIIEDEPMILMQLEDLAMSLDHEVCGTARTHAEAVASVQAEKPGLVLADIQLADGSSGLEAVEEILTISTVPVIFITAYPERLLTGDKIEPAYLVTKPFREQAVKAAISQALFLG